MQLIPNPKALMGHDLAMPMMLEGWHRPELPDDPRKRTLAHLLFDFKLATSLLVVGDLIDGLGGPSKTACPTTANELIQVWSRCRPGDCPTAYILLSSPPQPIRIEAEIHRWTMEREAKLLAEVDDEMDDTVCRMVEAWDNLNLLLNIVDPTQVDLKVLTQP